MTKDSSMRNLIAATGVLLVLSGGALAQNTTTNPPTSAAPPPAAQQVPRQVPPAINPLAREDVSRIIGASVYSADDRKVGTVSTVLMQPEKLQITQFVVREGGVLGIGAHHVALPLEDFSWDSAKGVFKVSYSVEELEAMPEWKEQLTQVPPQ